MDTIYCDSGGQVGSSPGLFNSWLAVEKVEDYEDYISIPVKLFLAAYPDRP